MPMTYKQIAAGLGRSGFALRGDGYISNGAGEEFYDPTTDQNWDQTEVDTFIANEAIALRNIAVNTERARRIRAGKTFTITGATIPLLGDDTTKQNLQALAFAASQRISQGDVTTVTRFRDADNRDHFLYPPQVLELFNVSAAWVSAVMEASWEIKASTVADVTEDNLWP